MRCPHCAEDNPEGVAVCLSCGTSLTAYGGQVMGGGSEVTRAKLARIAVRPAVVPVMAAFIALVAVAGPLWSVLSRFLSRPEINREGTNYVGAAFGAVGVALVALFLVPLAVAILVVAWGILTQRTWAWGAGVLVLAGTFMAGIVGYFFGPPLKYVVMVVCIALTVMWFRNDAREWYGA